MTVSKLVKGWESEKEVRLYRIYVGLIFGLAGGLIFRLSVGLIGGYLPLVQHFSLRLVLVRNHLLPRQLVPFLEYSVRLIFLRRVGGSYIFVHRLLMEHFAEMEV